MSPCLRLIVIAGFAVLLVACSSTPKPPENAVATPTFSPAEGTYAASQSVTISTSTEGAEIRYTTDTSEPTATAGRLYSDPISVSSTTTIKAIATKKGFKDSEVASATFTIQTAQVVPMGKTVEPVTDDEVSAVQNAIARAREVDADYYDPDNFDAARRLLDSALAVRTTDPATAHAQLAEAKIKADFSFDNSVAKAADDLGARMAALKQKLVDLEADKYAPDQFHSATAGIQEATELYNTKDYSAARARAWQSLHEMATLRDSLETRLDALERLRYDLEQDMKEAESTNAYSYAPAQKDKVTGMYLQGLQAQQEYKLGQAEESFGAALEAAREVLRIAKAARDAQTADEKQKAQEKQAQVMKALQQASELTVVTEDGTVVQPKNWSEDDFQKEVDQMQKEEEQNKSTVPGNQSMVMPTGDRTVVLADESAEDLLNQARQLWTLGLKENLAGNYTKAQDYFDEAQRYIDIYTSYAVKGVYTVRLIPDRRDCLWRIAEYNEIYGDPYQWPKIWRRNRKLIQNPDLILPGWQLVIPPR
jgi:nucleoid-associated protein YgaU